MKPFVIFCGLAALTTSFAAQSEPAKPQPPAEETLPVVRPQVRTLLETSPAHREVVAPGEGQIVTCESSLRAAPVNSQQTGTIPPPVTGDKQVAMNRILLVDLGERELKKRNELKAKDLDRSPETQAPDCTDGLKAGH